ncbi:MAG: hypothetical protein II410_05680, partial [Ruminococcus sp.]|nr:hypothetical protein [Ruminococcus sp.]
YTQVRANFISKKILFPPIYGLLSTFHFQLSTFYIVSHITKKYKKKSRRTVSYAAAICLGYY